MAAIDDILNTNNSGYNVTQSQLDADQVNDEARKKGLDVKAQVATPTLDERMAQWKVQNPMPQRQTVAEPELKQTYNYQDILDQYKKSDEVDPKVAKRHKWNESIAAVGDALTSIVNAAGTTNGANNMELDPSEGMAEKIRKRYQETRDKQKEDRQKYLNLMLKAAQLEDADNMKKLSMYQNAQQKADSDYNTKLNNWYRAYDSEADNQRMVDKNKADAEAKAENLKRQKERDEETVRHNKVMESQGEEAKSETRRHNRVMENKSSDDDGKGGKVKMKFGDYKISRSVQADELKGIVAEMYEAGCFKGAKDNLESKVKRGKVAAGTAITRGLKTKEGAAIMEKHGFYK